MVQTTGNRLRAGVGPNRSYTSHRTHKSLPPRAGMGPKSPEAFPCSLSPEARSLKSIKIINAQKNGRDGACSRHRHRPSPGNGPLERLLLTKLRGGEFGVSQRRLTPLVRHWRLKTTTSQGFLAFPGCPKGKERTQSGCSNPPSPSRTKLKPSAVRLIVLAGSRGEKHPTKQAPHIHGSYGFVASFCLPAPASSLRMRPKACDKMADHSASRTGRVTYIAPFSRAVIS